MDEAESFHRWLDEGATPAARLLARIRAQGLGRLGDVPVAALPEIPADLLHRRLGQADAEEFVAAPEWLDSPRESNCLTRQIAHPLVRSLEPHYGNGLMTRMAARLTELAGLPRDLLERLRRLGELPGGSERPGTGSAEGVGLGTVEAARGRLFHRAILEGGRVGRYQILAPTEWNFHPRGVVAQGLLGLPLGDAAELRRQATLLISAIDPCVGYRLEVI